MLQNIDMRSGQKVLAAMAAVLAACGGRLNVECEQDSNCNTAGGGVCTTNASTGSRWCAYPDPNCPSGVRFSDLDVGDGVSGECVDSYGDAGIDGQPGQDAALKWSEPTLLANVNTDAEERFPAPSKNGLELYFARLSTNAPYGEIFVARRSSTAQAFGAPSALTEVNGANSNEIFAVPSHSGLELFVSVAAEIFVYTRASAASQYANPVTTGIIANFVSLSADDLTMYFVARCPMGVHNGTGPCFWYSKRTAVGAAWSPPVNQPLDGTSQWSSEATSGDGLRLLVSANYSASGVPVAEQSRAAQTEGWSNTTVISTLALESTNKDARWNADGTEIFLSANPVTSSSTRHDIYVSVLR